MSEKDEKQQIKQEVSEIKLELQKTLSQTEKGSPLHQETLGLIRRVQRIEKKLRSKKA